MTGPATNGPSTTKTAASGKTNNAKHKSVTQLQQQAQNVATDGRGFKIPNQATAATEIPNAQFRSGDQGSWRQTTPLTTPDKSLEQGTGGRDVDDNSPFAEPRSSAKEVHADQPKAPDHNNPNHQGTKPGHAANTSGEDPDTIQH
jgi:hypothetical protein